MADAQRLKHANASVQLKAAAAAALKVILAALLHGAGAASKTCTAVTVLPDQQQYT
jgi:hypothetical protein